MKTLVGIFGLLASLSATATELKGESKVIMSCAGITLYKKAAIHLAVIESASEGLRAEISATNGESETISLERRGQSFHAIEKQKYFAILPRSNVNQKSAVVMWESVALQRQYSGLWMTCVSGRET